MKIFKNRRDKINNDKKNIFPIISYYKKAKNLFQYSSAFVVNFLLEHFHEFDQYKNLKTKTSLDY